MDSEPLVSLKFEFKNQLQALFETIAPRHGHWLTRNREVNKTNTRAVEGLSEEAINACIFPKRAFTLVHDRSRSSVQKKSRVAKSAIGTVKKMRVQKKSINQSKLLC